MEFIIIVPILLIFWIGITSLAGMYAAKQKMAGAARYGAWLAKNEIPDELVKAKMSEYLLKNKFLRGGVINVEIKEEDIKLYYRVSQYVVKVTYAYRLFPDYFPPYLLTEKCIMNRDSWKFSDIEGRKKHYRDNGFDPEYLRWKR